MSIAILRSAFLPRRALLLAFAMSFAAISASHAAVEISKKPTQNMTCSAGVCTPTANNAVLNVDDLAGMLASADTTIKSTSQNPDIEIDAELSWTSTHRLTLDSYRAIAFSQPVEVTGSGALTITTNDGGKNGDFSFAKKGHVEFWDTHSGLTINGKSYRLVEDIRALSRELRHTDGSGMFLALSKSGKPGKRSYSVSPIDKEFEGTFEGLGNTVSHLTIDSSAHSVALFDAIGLSGMVRDLRLVQINLSANGFGDQFVGALAGGSSGAVLNCQASGQLSASGSETIYGGLVGVNAGSIIRSGASVVMNVTGDNTTLGGLVGKNLFSADVGTGTIEESYASGALTGGDGSTVGGLVGENSGGRVYNSYATGAIKGGGDAVVGGLIGSYSNPETGPQPRLDIAYSTGTVSGGSGATLGGSIGEDLSGHGVKSTYWDLDTSGISDPSRGAGNVANDPGITGLTTEQFKSGLPAGFDKKVWKEKPSINGGYPYLIGNLPPQ
jgi:hypothetical protein